MCNKQKGESKMRKTYVMVALVVMVCAGSYAGQVWNFDTDGDFQGWFDHNNRMTDKQVLGGTLKFSTTDQKDPQWRLKVDSLDASVDLIFEVVVRRTSGDARAKPAFYVYNGVKDLQLQPGRIVTLKDDEEFQTVQFKYKGGSLPSITVIRFDPVTNEVGSWEINSISVP
jgi:hypothetical protein